jgi:hypothetical protein
MTKLQSILDLANRMISAGLDEIAVAEVLVDQIKEHIDNLKCEAFDLMPVIPTTKTIRIVCKNTVQQSDLEDDLLLVDEPNWSEEKKGW